MSAPRPAPNPALGFILRFLVVWGVLLGVVALVPAILSGAITGTLHSSRAALALFGIRAHILADVLAAGAAQVRIIPDCTPVFPFATLAAAILAFPATWRARLVGLAAALPLLWVYNVVRVLVSFAVLATKPALFDLVHGVLWQAFTIVFLLGLFLLWARAAAPRPA